MSMEAQFKVTRAEDVARTRARILAVARDQFLQRPFAEVTLNEVAAEAGITRQTVLNHFASKDNLFLEAAATVAHARDSAAPGIEGALDGLVLEYEETGDAVVRLLQVEEQFEAVHALMQRGREGHYEWVSMTFATHLPDDGEKRRRGILSLVAATDVYVWKLLRRDLGVDVEAARDVIGALVAGALDQMSEESA